MNSTKGHNQLKAEAMTNTIKPESKTMIGYSGFRPKVEDAALDLTSPNKKYKIPGYTGHIAGTRDVYGKPVILSQTEQMKNMDHRSERIGDFHRKAKTLDFTNGNYDLREIYLNAMETIWHRGQTPQMLLRILQGKVSERTSSYANQLIQVRKLFESFDYEGCGSLNIHGFRKCLEYICCQFDEAQSTALFGYFDVDHSGTIDWTELAENVMVHNPKSGKLVPKQITATMFNEDWSNLSKKMDF